MVNSSLTNGIFPENLRNAGVCPISKAGEKSDLTNYRPISLLPTFSKIYEKIIVTRLLSYIEKRNIIVSS